jgi:hypothetical protein
MEDICYELKKLYVASLMLDMFNKFKKRITMFTENIQDIEDISFVADEYISLRNDLQQLMDSNKDMIELLRNLADKYGLSSEYNNLMDSIKTLINRPFYALCHYTEFYDAFELFKDEIDIIAERLYLGSSFSYRLLGNFESAIGDVVERIRKHKCAETQ